MVSIQSLAAGGAETSVVLDGISDRVSSDEERVRFVFVFYGCDHDGSAIHEFVRKKFSRAAVIGGTSCAGIMNDERLWGADSIGLLLIDDDAGDYGAAQGTIGEDGATSAEGVLKAALEAAGCPGELPELIWVYQMPGREEDVIDGLRRVVGDRCPIIGGSSADNTVEGNWRQLGPDGVLDDGLVVGVLFPSGGVSYSFQGGYEPAGPSGIVTRVERAAGVVNGPAFGSRKIMEIDGVSASATYNRWVGNRLEGKLAAGGNILRDTTMYPLALEAGEIAGIPQFRLVHPESLTADGGVNMFARIEEGARIHAMQGDRGRLVERAGRVAREAAARLPGGASSLAGGMVVYCAGCMLAVDDRMPEVSRQVSESFAGAPYLGCFTFGEQGCQVDRNVHGNLMISAVAFGQ